MWTPDYFVRLVELPPTIDGTVVPNDDGSFDIYINSRSPEEKRRAWLEHELDHIRRDHFTGTSPSPPSRLRREAFPYPKKAGNAARYLSFPRPMRRRNTTFPADPAAETGKRKTFC